MINIKDFLFKIKEDLKQLFFYPQPDWGEDGKIDYNKYWMKRRPAGNLVGLSSWQKKRADLVLPFLSDGDIVVDIGGGGGEMLSYWQNQKKINGWCADFSQLALAQARAKGLETIDLDLSDISSLSNLPNCDFLTGFEVLEHLPNPEEFVLAVISKARKGLIFSFPNTGYYKHRLRLLFGCFPLQWVVHPGEHLRFWTVRDVRFWVKTLGLQLDKMILYEGLPFLSHLWPSLFGQGIIFFISKEK